MMTEKERLEVFEARYRLTLNGIMFFSTEKGLEDQAVALRLKDRLKDLIKKELLDEPKPNIKSPISLDQA